MLTCALKMSGDEETVVSCRSPRWCKDTKEHFFCNRSRKPAMVMMCLHTRSRRVTLAGAPTCGTTRWSSPGGVQVSSSAAPQTHARLMPDLNVSKYLFVCVSMSRIQTFKVSESFQWIPSLGSERQISSDLSRILYLPGLRYSC